MGTYKTREKPAEKVPSAPMPDQDESGPELVGGAGRSPKGVARQSRASLQAASQSQGKKGRAEETAGDTGRARKATRLQRQVGNARVGRMGMGDALDAGPQAKIEVSAPEDAYEHEADRVAEQITNGQAVPRISTLAGNVARPMHQSSEAPSEMAVESEVEQSRLKVPGGGRPVAEGLRAEMEAGLGEDLSDVRVHDSSEDQGQAEGLGARAFTYGNDVWLGPGESASDRKLMAHELAHVVQQRGTHRGSVQRRALHNNLGGVSRIQRQGLLTSAQEASAIAYTRTRYDERSVRIIQITTGANVDGVFGSRSAEAVAGYQSARGLTIDGKTGPQTLNAMVPDRAAAGRHEHAIQLVVDFYNLDTASDTLSVSFDPTQIAAGNTRFETGNLRVITLGAPAFVSEAVLRATIAAQLAAPAPAVAVPGPRPNLLTRGEERSAISYNQRHFSDERSVLAIQGFVGTGLDSVWGPDTVQRIAQEQQIAGLAVDGKVGRNTLEHIVLRLIATGNQNAAIRLIVDFYNFRDNGNLLSVYYDPTVAANASTDYRPNEPVRVRVGPSGLAQPFPGIVHTIAHEYEHVRRLKQGIVPAATHEFLGEAIEILSVGMPEEHLEAVAPGTLGYVPGFANDALRALNNWNNMPVADQRRFRARFVAVRRVVRRRIAAGNPAQQALHAGLLAAYNAVVLP